MSYVLVRQLLGSQAYIARDRSEVNPGAKEAEELVSFPGTLSLV